MICDVNKKPKWVEEKSPVNIGRRPPTIAQNHTEPNRKGQIDQLTH